MRDALAPIEVFCSYAPEDSAFCHELEKHLSLLLKEERITIWHNRLILPGNDWSQAIDEHLKAASLILLLISPDFMASNYCYGIEMQRALQQQQPNKIGVIPILLRPVDWESAPFAGLQVLPTNAEPITLWPNQDAAWAHVVACIRSIILDEQIVFRENMALRTTQHELNIRRTREFEQTYRQQVNNRHAYIIPPDFDRTRKIPIDDLYVEPHFVLEQGSQSITLSALLADLHRTVILGHPGGGKSTLALKLCHELATRYEEQLIAGKKELTPILVVLRDYGAMKKTRHCSILEYIKIKAQADYQVAPPPGGFKSLLLNNRVFVIFDGLDELLDTGYRQEIGNDIESFCHRYPSIPVIITSRKVGYEQAPLDPERFKTFHIAPFDILQVREYVKKWFNVLTDLSVEQQQQTVTAFLRESLVVTDLRANPLMLALLCNIYRGENYIPKNRPDVYKKCATMLFERWDKRRSIHVLLPFDAHIRPAMMYLAYWIYTDEALRGGVSETRLVEKTREYLQQKLYTDPDEAEKAAQEFIEFCRGRAWVFTDVGTTAEGRVLYDFTHQTFLEYFAASYLCRTHPTAPSLLEMLLPKIVKREWDVVAQLAFQIQNEQVEDAGDILLGTLVAQFRGDKGTNGWNLLSFAVRCLQFIIPSPAVTREITAASLECTLRWGLERTKKGKVPNTTHSLAYDHGYKPEDIFGALLEALPDNRRTILPSLEKLLIEIIQHGDEPEALLATELALYIENFLKLSENVRGKEVKELDWQTQLRNVVHDLWSQTVRRIYDSCSRIPSLCEKYLQLCFPLLVEERLSIAYIVKWHGIYGLLKEYSCIIFPNTIWTSIASQLIMKAIELHPVGQKEATVEKCLTILRNIGSYLLTYPYPWFEEQQWDADMSPLSAFPMILSDWPIEQKKLSKLDLDADVLFGIFVLVALLIEINKSPRFAKSCTWTLPLDSTQDLLQVISTSQHPLFALVRALFLTRYDDYTSRYEAVREMDECKFSVSQCIFLWHWIHKEENLVKTEVSTVEMRSSNSVNDDDAVEERRGRGKKILITDDYKEQVHLLSRVLLDEWPDLSFSFAYDGDIALKKIAQDPPSLLILDLKMPVMGGLEVLRELNRQGVQFPILIYSAAVWAADEAAAFIPTARLYTHLLRKPYELDTMLDKVKEMLFGDQ